MADFDAESFDVSLTGFDADEVDALLNRFYSHEAVEDDFDADTEKKKISDAGGPVSQSGDMWRLGDHVLICGDPTGADTYARLLGNDTAQCAITSPPVDPKAYAKDGIDPWMEKMAAVIRAAHAVRRDYLLADQRPHQDWQPVHRAAFHALHEAVC